MHSFEVDIRICQPENSDVHRGEAIFSYFYLKYFHIYKFTLKSDVPSALSLGRLFQQISATLMR